MEPRKCGKGWYDQYQQKGKRKGMQGNCYNCGEPGTPARLCPHPPKGKGKGKGIKGTCWNCGEQGHRAEDCPSTSKGMNQIGAGLSFGGGDGDSDSGPEKEPPAEEKPAQWSQEQWAPDNWNNADQYDRYDPYGYNHGFYGAWSLSKDEPKEEEWTVVEKNRASAKQNAAIKGQ